MSENTTETTETQQQEPSGEQARPPWERDGQPFDPERAWNLITTLRNEREQLRSEREQLSGEVNQFRTAQLTDQQRLEAERDSLRSERDQTASELTRLRVAMRHGLTDEDFDLLGSGTEQEIEARAQRVADLRRSQQQEQRIPASFDGGTRTPAAGADMNQLIRRSIRG